MPEVAALKIHECLDRVADLLNIGVGRIWKKGQLPLGLFSRYEWKCLAVIEKMLAAETERIERCLAGAVTITEEASRASWWTPFARIRPRPVRTAPRKQPG